MWRNIVEPLLYFISNTKFFFSFYWSIRFCFLNAHQSISNCATQFLQLKENLYYIHTNQTHYLYAPKLGTLNSNCAQYLQMFYINVSYVTKCTYEIKWQKRLIRKYSLPRLPLFIQTLCSLCHLNWIVKFNVKSHFTLNHWAVLILSVRFKWHYGIQCHSVPFSIFSGHSMHI